jgi:hypothetical protein
MRKETKEVLYKTFNELTEDEKIKAIELEMKNHHWNDIYFDMRKEDFDEFIIELKQDHKIDFELDWECGSSYSFIKEINFKEIIIDFPDYELVIESSHYYGKDVIDTFFSFYTEDNAKKEDYKLLEDYKKIFTKIKDSIYDTFKHYETAFVYGWDDDFDEWLLENLMDNDYEYNMEDITE